jgi:hypothetical protein
MDFNNVNSKNLGQPVPRTNPPSRDTGSLTIVLRPTENPPAAQDLAARATLLEAAQIPPAPQTVPSAPPKEALEEDSTIAQVKQAQTVGNIAIRQNIIYKKVEICIGYYIMNIVLYTSLLFVGVIICLALDYCFQSNKFERAVNELDIEGMEKALRWGGIPLAEDEDGIKFWTQIVSNCFTKGTDREKGDRAASLIMLHGGIALLNNLQNSPFEKMSDNERFYRENLLRVALKTFEFKPEVANFNGSTDEDSSTPPSTLMARVARDMYRDGQQEALRAVGGDYLVTIAQGFHENRFVKS